MSELTGPDLRRGPFINEDGDVWVPATVGGIVAARRIGSVAVYDGRLHFEGMEDASMSVHEYGDSDCSGDCEQVQPCTWTARAYHFREVER